MRIYLSFACILLLGCMKQADKEKSSAEKDALLYVRNAHSMAYHSKDSLVYLFGGANHEEVLSDLWVLDSTKWRRMETVDGPEPRTFAPLAYDSDHNRLVLFGGSKVLFGTTTDSRNLLNDTWLYENNQWQKLLTDHAPSPRAEATMVYDENRRTVILFGGYTIEGDQYVKLKDSWAFHDNDWHLLSTEGPSGRHGVAMAYNRQDTSVMLFGGSTVDRQYGDASGETWTWDGKEWSKLTIGQPPGVFNASMVYDQGRDELIRFGGWNGTSRINETWSFSNNGWNLINTNSSPSPRNHSAMVYDEKRKKVILYGGHDGENIYGDTWEYAHGEWESISEDVSVKRVDNGH